MSPLSHTAYLTTLIHRLLLIAFLLGIQSISYAQHCADDHRYTEKEYFPLTSIESRTNLTYGHALDYQGQLDTLLLDVYFADTMLDTLKAKPLVFVMHGGAFRVGRKEQIRTECISFAMRGFVVVSINYRLGWDILNPIDQVLATYRAQQDAHAALRYLVQHQRSFQIDTNWIFVGGGSAGAVTANNLVYADKDEWESVYPGITNLLGELDTSSNNWTGTFTIKGVYNNWGAAPKDGMQAEEMVPQIAFHGAQDGTVEIDSSGTGILIGSRGIHHRLINQSVCSDLTVDPQGGHGIYIGIQGAVFRTARASCFFKSIFCNSCSDFYSTDSIAAACSQITGMEEYSTHAYQVYPNPFSDQIRVKGLRGNESFSLFSFSGQQIYTGVSLNELHLAKLKSGLYLLRIQSGSEIKSYRMMKE